MDVNDGALKDAVAHERGHNEGFRPERLGDDDRDTSGAVDTFVLPFSKEKDRRSSELLLPWKNRQKDPIQYNITMMVQTT